MSDVIDEDDRFFGRQLLLKSQTAPLRERMKAFTAEHPAGDLKDVRSRVSTGQTDLSEVVTAGREERL